jgi:hypothetical protein
MHSSKPAGTRSESIPVGDDIGRLVKVSPNDVWQASSFDISNWLVENSDVAKDVLGFELRKVPGWFSGGSHTIEDPSGRKVVIVSQLNGTSSAGLGNLISLTASSGQRLQSGLLLHRVLRTSPRSVGSTDWALRSLSSNWRPSASPTRPPRLCSPFSRTRSPATSRPS